MQPGYANKENRFAHCQAQNVTIKKKGTCKTQPTRNVASTSRMNTPGKTKTLRVAAQILSPYPPNTSLHDLVFFCLDPFRRSILGSRTVRLQKKNVFSNPHCYAYGKADHHPLRTANRLWKHPWSVPSQQARDLLPAAGCSIRGGIPDTFLGTLPANEQKIKIRKNVCSQELREIRTPRNLRPHFVTIKKHFWQWNSGSLESACDVTKIL